MEAGKFKGKYRIKSTRLESHDYGSNGFYFVTICTKEKIHYFGEIVDTLDETETHCYASLRGTEIAKIANDCWLAIPEHYPFVILDEFIIMPHHLHAIIAIHKEEETTYSTNTFGPQSRNLGAIIRGFKSSVKRDANKENIDFHWQARFHDHIIKDEKTLCAVRNYILANPRNWQRDKSNAQGLKM
jgi:REP element-mobilizing transposase RayT